MFGNIELKCWVRSGILKTKCYAENGFSACVSKNVETQYPQCKVIIIWTLFVEYFSLVYVAVDQ